MPRFEPFQGLRYRPEVAPMAQVIAPPYDVISATERTHLASRHQANSVLVEVPEADLPAGRDRYAVARELFTRWQAERIVVAEATPSLYPYRMTDTSGRATTGVIGALGLADPGEDSDILPHEQTLPKPKSDRLDLLRATRANLSPIWGLSMAAGVTATFDPTDDDPVADVYDDDGVRHQLWVLSDADTVAAVQAALSCAPVVLADGHHRYETARAYQAECRQANGGAAGPHDLVMALVVELSEDQLTVGAIHRTISGLPDGFDLVGVLAPVVRRGPSRRGRRPDARGALRLALLDPRDGRAGLPAPGPRRRRWSRRATTWTPTSSPRCSASCRRTRSCTATASARPWGRWRRAMPRPPSSCAPSR